MNASERAQRKLSAASRQRRQESEREFRERKLGAASRQNERRHTGPPAPRLNAPEKEGSRDEEQRFVLPFPFIPSPDLEAEI